MIIKKGEEVEIGDIKGIITKVSAMPTMIRRGTKFYSTMRIYYKHGKKKGHCDCELPKDMEVVFG